MARHRRGLNQEVASAGLPVPPLGERFEMLEETLIIAHEMWQGERGSERSLDGRHYRAGRLLGSPQSISRIPRPPIMVGGGGEKTLRLVAQYADACNVFGSPEGIARKYAILDQHCADVGRDPREIERSTLQGVRLGPAHAAGPSRRSRSSTDSGSCGTPVPSTSSSTSRTASTSRPMEVLGRDVLPALHDLVERIVSPDGRTMSPRDGDGSIPPGGIRDEGVDL